MADNKTRLRKRLLLNLDENGFEQVVYYQAGIGADAELGLFQKGTENINGTKVLSNIRTAYGFICENYDYGDEIYITGFSRGAYIARSVAGLVAKVGLLTKKGQELFYEAFEYYTSSNVSKDQKRVCPVSEAAGTTRVHLPFRNPPQAIKIRAVGVWDTVVGLGEDKLAFHDTTLSPICPNIPRPLETLEQCWMAGVHSNIEGSWEEQQISDITLAWMMSRFDALGVKFDQNYLYQEYIKFQDWVKTEGPAAGYPADLSPRQWGEGTQLLRKVHQTLTEVMIQAAARKFLPLGISGGAVEYRERLVSIKGSETQMRRCTHAYATVISANTKKDGKIGEGAATTTSGPLKYTKGELAIPESPMGKYEKQYLGFYDEDPKLRARDGSIWEKVLGGKNGPSQHTKDGVAEMKKPNANPYKDTTTQRAEKLYIGKRSPVPWDESILKDHAALGGMYRVGSWNGNDNSSQGGPAPFSSLCSIEAKSRIVSIRSFHDPHLQVLAGFSVWYNDNIHEWYTWGQEGYEESTMTLTSDERIVKTESKSVKPPNRANLIGGIKLTTNKGQVWASCANYDKLSSDMMVSEDSPGSEWSLKGFYGGLGWFVDRIGPI
ncbi:MAG: hypothetical protein Q9200_003231 [Gallowayella weberi]